METASPSFFNDTTEEAESEAVAGLDVHEIEVG